MKRERDFGMKTTAYFRATRRRRDRLWIKEEWIMQVARSPEMESIQADGRIRRWGRIHEADGRWLRVVLLADGKTIHNAFFDRGFKP